MVVMLITMIDNFLSFNFSHTFESTIILGCMLHFLSFFFFLETVGCNETNTNRLFWG